MSVRRSVKAAQEKARAKGTFPKGVFQMDKPTGSILKWDRSEGATFAGIGDDSSVGSNKSSQSNRNNRKLHCNEKVGMPELGNNVFTYIQPNQLSKYLKSKKAVQSILQGA